MTGLERRGRTFRSLQSISNEKKILNINLTYDARRNIKGQDYYFIKKKG